MTYVWRPSDHAFEAFLASRKPEDFKGEERSMFAFFRKHPDQLESQAVQRAMLAYARGKRKAS